MPASAPPRISVIIPVYNQAAYLAEAVDSVLRQSLPAAEVIVINDGSTDETAAVAARFGARLITVHQPNAGLGAARNAGIGLAHGDYLAFLDGDDWWEPAKLEQQHRLLAQQPQLDMVFGQCRQFVSPELPPEKRARISGDGSILNGVVAGGMLARRAVFEKNGLFATHFQIGEFIDWFSRAKDSGLTHVVTEDIVLHRRLHGENMSLKMKEHRGDYLAILRASLQRKRQGG